MADRIEKIVEAIQKVSVIDYEHDDGRPIHVGEVTAAMIYNVVKKQEPEAEDGSWEIKPEHNDAPQPYCIWHDASVGLSRILLSSGGSDPVSLRTEEEIDGLIKRLQRSKIALGRVT
jgi:hypothetical protein